MKFSLACGDVMPGCMSRFESTSHDDLLQQMGAHAASSHGITDITPDLLRRVESTMVSSA